MRNVLILATALLCVTSAASAQVSDAKLDKARQVVEIQGGVKMYSAAESRMVEQLTDGAVEMIKRLELPSRPVRKDILQTIVGEDFENIFVPKAIEYAAHIYAEEFSEQELTDILAFYNSPSGRAYAAKQTAILKKSTLMEDVMPGVWRDVLLRYCKQTNCPQGEYDRLEESTDPKPRGKPH